MTRFTVICLSFTCSNVTSTHTGKTNKTVVLILINGLFLLLKNNITSVLLSLLTSLRKPNQEFRGEKLPRRIHNKNKHTHCYGRILMCCFIHREELLQSLAIVQHCLLGAGSLLSPLDGLHVPDL